MKTTNFTLRLDLRPNINVRSICYKIRYPSFCPAVFCVQVTWGGVEEKHPFDGRSTAGPATSPPSGTSVGSLCRDWRVGIYVITRSNTWSNVYLVSVVTRSHTKTEISFHGCAVLSRSHGYVVEVFQRIQYEILLCEYHSLKYCSMKYYGVQDHQPSFFILQK